MAPCGPIGPAGPCGPGGPTGNPTNASGVFDVVPGSESEFCAGYGTNPWTTTEGRRRHHVSLGLELLSGLLYWKRTGQSEMLGDYQRRFGEWSASID